MDLNEGLITQLRNMASQGAAVRLMVNEIKNHIKTEDGLSLVADAYFHKAFMMPLGQIRDIEGSHFLGGKAYTDEQIDHIMLPRIASTRHLWEGK